MGPTQGLKLVTTKRSNPFTAFIYNVDSNDIYIAIKTRSVYENHLRTSNNNTPILEVCYTKFEMGSRNYPLIWGGGHNVDSDTQDLL